MLSIVGVSAQFFLRGLHGLLVIVTFAYFCSADSWSPCLERKEAHIAFVAHPLFARPHIGDTARAPFKTISRRVRGAPYGFCKVLRATMKSESTNGLQMLQDMLRTLPRTGGYETISDLFRKYDLDKSGSIDAAELKEAMCDLGAKVTDEEVQSLLQSIDANGDGEVDWSEFENYLEIAQIRITQEGKGSEEV